MCETCKTHTGLGKLLWWPVVYGHGFRMGVQAFLNPVTRWFWVSRYVKAGHVEKAG